MYVSVAWSLESLPSNSAAQVRFPVGSEILYFHPRAGCVFFVYILSSFVSGGGSDILLITRFQDVQIFPQWMNTILFY